MVDSGSNAPRTNGGADKVEAPVRCRVGVALSGGAARSMAHIGVLKAIEAQGVRIDCVAGTRPWPVQKLTTQPDGGLPMTVTRR